MALGNIDHDRAAYLDYVQRFWADLAIGDSVKANLESEQSSKIAKHWANEGRIAEFLTPLLSHEMEAVRYAASADLLNHVTSDAAVRVLRDVANKPEGLIAPTAKLLLMKKRIPLRER